MRWQQVLDHYDDDIKATGFAFVNHADIPDAPPKTVLFRNVAEHFFGPNTIMPYQWHPWNLRALELACEQRYLANVGCANSSKTSFWALWGLLNWYFDPVNTLVLVTSTSLKDSRKRMWGQIVRFAQHLPDFPGTIIDSMGVIRATGHTDSSSISLIAGEKKNDPQAIGKLIGMKNKRLILVADELPELSAALYKAFLSNLAVNESPQMIGIGNFASIYDPLGEFSRPKDGWSSIKPEDSEWETELGGYCLRFDGLKSPNFDYPRDRWLFLYNRRNLKDHQNTLGENSIEFWRMVRSYPCPAGTQDCIYSDADFLAANAEESVTFDRTPVKVACLDPSYTHDGDRCPVIFGEYGRVKNIQTLLFIRYKLLIEDVSKTTEPRDFQIARQFMRECEAEGVRPENACLDSTGAGKPFLSIVHEVWNNSVTGIEFGGSASDVPVFSHDRRPASDLYANRVSEIWVSGRDYLRAGQIKGVMADLAREMKARKYPKPTERQTVNKKIVIESKKQMKTRTGWSPDLADSALGLLLFCRQRFGFMAEQGRQSFGHIRSTMRNLALQYDKVNHVLYRG